MSLKNLQGKNRVNYTKRLVLMGLSICIFFACSLSGCVVETTSVNETKPNIVLIITDDQGYGDIAINDNPILSTPALDALAASSTAFTSFHVDPTCSPTRAAIMSGQYSLRAGVWHTVMGRHLLSTDTDTLPEKLQREGYQTALFGKWHLGDNYPFRPQDQGFEYVLSHGAGGVGQTPDVWGNTQFNDTFLLNGKMTQYSGYATDVWFDEAIKYMQRKAPQGMPFFLYIATNAPHSPFRVPEQYSKPYLDLGLDEKLSIFYGMITNLDNNIAKLQQAMNELEISENTIFIFMTDNGSVLGGYATKLLEKGDMEVVEASLGKKVHTLNFHMKGAKASVYQGGHRVPFYIRWPAANIDKARNIDGLAAHFDLMPTLLDMIGADIDGIETDGISLKASILDGETLPKRTIIVTNQRVLEPYKERPFAVLKDHWRLVKASQNSEEIALYNVATDRGETINLAEDYPDVVKSLNEEYERWWQKTTKDGVPTMRPEIGSELENPIRLTSHDWLAPDTGQVAWFPGYLDDKFMHQGWIGNEEKFVISPWKIRALDKGKYSFTLLLHDVPAKKVIPRQFAHLNVNDKIYSTRLNDGDYSATFVVDIDSEDIDVYAWFDNTLNNSDKPLAVFYLYAERLGAE